MDSQKQIWANTAPVVIGQSIGIAAVAGLFILLGRFDLTVLAGSLAGALLATANYFVLYLFACRAADKAEMQDIAGGQKVIQLSYIGRMIGLFTALVLLAKSGWCNVIALAVPLALNRPILTIYELLCKRGANDEYQR